MKKWHYPFLAFLIIGTILILSGNKPVYRTSEGAVFGTFYHITYNYNQDLQAEIESSLAKVDSSLSMFNPKSTIAAVNASSSMQVSDEMFLYVVRLAQQVSQWTDGAFDITVAPAVNAWGFGFKHKEAILADTTILDSLREIVSYKLFHEDNGFITKDKDGVMLDCSAIAKGYGCDVVADMLRSHGISDFMVEIGGEVVVSGKNPKGHMWHIGVSKPVEDESSGNELQTILELSEIAMATSGNYRNFYYENGRRYAHTIDPKSCRPVQHSLLSATVLADNCATADALATSMMVMGLERSLQVCSSLDGIEAYFIFQGEDGQIDVAYTDGFARYLPE